MRKRNEVNFRSLVIKFLYHYSLHGIITLFYQHLIFKMKIRFTLILAALLLVGFSASTQKLKDKRVNIKFVSPPSVQLSDDFQTYSVSVSGRSHITSGSTSESIANAIKMDGFKRLTGNGNDFGHLRILPFIRICPHQRWKFKI